MIAAEGVTIDSTDIFSVSGKIACVTGASSGLGRAAAAYLALNGAQVVGVARRKDRLTEWSTQTEGETATVPCDLADTDDFAALADQIAAPFGPPDILINAAGLNKRLSAKDTTPSDWKQTMDLNLNAPFFLAQALVPAMLEKGWGRIVNFASLQSRRAFSNGISYGASKGGIEQMTRAMAEEWSHGGVLTNALAPGFFETELTAAVFDQADVTERLATQTCIGRNGVPDDLHGPLLFLCSDASRYVTGQLLFVDGGFTAK